MHEQSIYIFAFLLVSYNHIMSQKRLKTKLFLKEKLNKKYGLFVQIRNIFIKGIVWLKVLHIYKDFFRCFK